MSDEESFVILGTSPTPSMDTINSLPLAEAGATATDATSVQLQNGVTKNVIVESQLTTSSSSDISQFSVFQNGDVHLPKDDKPNCELQQEKDVSAQPVLASVGHNGDAPVSQLPPTTERFDKLLTDILCPRNIEEVQPANRSEALKNPVNINQQLTASSSSSDGSLAASFILGEINSDVLKESVYSQFPSLSMGACPEDVVKLQNMLFEYVQLKKTLKSTNEYMHNWHNHIKHWKNIEENHKNEIAKLRNENLELKREVESKLEQITISEEQRRNEHAEFVQSLSERTAQIQNMSAQIQKLEEQQLASFEVIPKNRSEPSQSNSNQEYVPSLEHQRIVKNLERQVSAAQKSEIKDMQEKYVNEIICLKHNLAKAEEVQKKAQSDIDFLKSSDKEKMEIFFGLTAEQKSLRDEIDALRHQADIYSREFKIEKEARQNLANEKELLLSEVRVLQRKNQELIKEAQKNYEEQARQMSVTGAFRKARPPQTVTSYSPSPSPSPSTQSSPDPIYTPANYDCPLCGRIFKTLNVLQKHVQQCLDEN